MTCSYSSCTQKGEQSLSFLHCGYLLVGDSTVLCDLPIGAVDGIFTGRTIPTGIEFNTLPLGNRSIKMDLIKHAASIKGRMSYTRHTIRNCNACQRAAISKGIISYTGNTIRNRNVCQRATSAEGKISYTGHTIRNCNACQRAAISKGVISYAGHTIRNCNARQRAAISKGIISYAGHTIRNRNAF